MAYADIEVPKSLLLEQRLTAADKLIWMIMRLDRSDYSGRKLASPSRLAKRVNLSRFTVYNSLERLRATGWLNGQSVVRRGAASSDCVVYPNLLIRSKELQPRDIVMYGLIQAEQFTKQWQLTYLAVGKYAQLDVRTVRRAMLALAQAGWIETKQQNQKAPIHIKLASPVEAYRFEIERRIETSQFWGEAIGREMVLFRAAQANFAANTKPHWLTSRVTGALLEVDLLIEEYDLVMEFQGEQHFHETTFSSAEEVAKQQARDAEKAEIINQEEKKLVVLEGDDLSLETVQKKLAGLAPLRDLEGLELVRNYLEQQGRKYKYWMARRKAEREAQRRAAEQAQQEAAETQTAAEQNAKKQATEQQQEQGQQHTAE